ncbi:Gfo/Idh/MocA family protein [Streptomyces sp. WI04-05B]|uniref:Gfo/Idh/MocA family protein n=1 Tax=Streptomyces TaxID=1883 RepID=UPI0029B2E1DA|nr:MULTISPECIES: Gfo/Idh/MocA family oxidoreductase [unclassified Streptomyces]MDX2547974.1 Gfo/Idh/MocA family oxidoreductase [Streptomyces sp. WI04-05B]MDX2582835.1 Gfo/Idh/MocA family oxidoreductase [Streptomyces sp. WI04-05A]MDX3746852.1 Gfo/Idh/MocA family oxidoreductase [Streptomyces sp. AK08-02]
MRVRAAVVGLGWAGRELWLRLLREHEDFEVVAVVDPDPRSRAATVAATGLPAHATVDALDPRTVDVAVVAVPNHLHAEVAADLLRQGISVFLEKPVCLTGAEADALAEAERDGGTLLAGSAAAHRGDVRELAGLLPELGRIRHVGLAWVRARGVPQPGGWFTQRSKAGGGVLVDLGWHLLDVLTSLLGPAPVVQVIGSVSDDFVNSGAWSAAWREDRATDVPAGDVEDTARGFLVREDGISVSLRASWASHEALDASVVTIEGSAGTARLHCTFGFSPNRAPEPVLTLTREGTTQRIPLPTEPIGVEYGRQLDGLAGLLADPGRRGLAVAQARSTVRLVENFYASARAARPVDRADDSTTYKEVRTA